MSLRMSGTWSAGKRQRDWQQGEQSGTGDHCGERKVAQTGTLMVTSGGKQFSQQVGRYVATVAVVIPTTEATCELAQRR